jgi:hypothetical protein
MRRISQIIGEETLHVAVRRGADIPVPVGRAMIPARVAKHAELGRHHILALHDLAADAIGILVQDEVDGLEIVAIDYPIEQDPGLHVGLPLPARWIPRLTVIGPPLLVALEHKFAVLAQRLQLIRRHALPHDEVALIQQVLPIHLDRHDGHILSNSALIRFPYTIKMSSRPNEQLRAGYHGRRECVGSIQFVGREDFELGSG